jgi:hypothetical protein
MKLKPSFSIQSSKAKGKYAAVQQIISFSQFSANVIALLFLVVFFSSSSKQMK